MPRTSVRGDLHPAQDQTRVPEPDRAGEVVRILLHLYLDLSTRIAEYGEATWSLRFSQNEHTTQDADGQTERGRGGPPRGAAARRRRGRSVTWLVRPAGPRLRRGARAGLIALLLVGGCADVGSRNGSEADEPLLVMAAASLSTAMPALIDRFESQTGTSVDLALGATGSMAAQIENGAPADLFFAADEATVERLVENGSIRPASVRTYGVGQLGLVWRENAERPGSLQQLSDSRYEVIAIANPEIAPYGAAAREALGRSGVWEAVEPKLVRGENIVQTLQLVQTGNADVALVARSVVADATMEFIPIDPQLHTPIRQAAGILKSSTHPAAEQFLAYVLSDEGQSTLAERGFGRAAPR